MNCTESAEKENVGSAGMTGVWYLSPHLVLQICDHNVKYKCFCVVGVQVTNSNESTEHVPHCHPTELSDGDPDGSAAACQAYHVPALQTRVQLSFMLAV